MPRFLTARADFLRVKSGENIMSQIDHTFAVCAYKETPYLEEAVRSALNQTVKGRVLISTGTPNSSISAVADRYNIPVFVNNCETAGTISGDWNFALSCAKTQYVTIAHQDDLYEPDYVETVLNKARKRKAVILFSDYYEIRKNERVYKNRLLKVKRLMNLGFALFPRSRFVKRRVLSMGCSICCPAVTFNRAMCGDFKFDGGYKNNLDWDAWIRLADIKGAFVYIRKPLMGHRIHEDSSTSEYIASGIRHDETVKIFRRFWPEWFVKRLIKAYENGDKSNRLSS